MGSNMQTKLRGCAFAGQAGPGWVGGGQSGAFGVAGHGAPLGVRQMLGQPGLALRQRQRVRQYHLDAVQRIFQSQQVVPHEQGHFANDVRG